MIPSQRLDVPPAAVRSDRSDQLGREAALSTASADVYRARADLTAVVAELRKLESECRRAAQSGQNAPPPETLARMVELRAEQSRLHRQRHTSESHLSTLRSQLPPEAV
jgi:hypothetical protein